MKAAIFDKDGTLFDTEHYYQEAWFAVSRQMHFELTDPIRQILFGRSGKDQIRMLAKEYPDIPAREFVARFTAMAEANIVNGPFSLKSGVIEILNYFSSIHIPMAVASGAPRWLIQKNLETAHIDHYFCVISSGLDVYHSKPHPDVFLDACCHLHEKPSDCMVFEDSPNGVLAAHRAGCYTVWIPENSASMHPVNGTYDQVFTDFYQVLDWIK